MKAKDQIRVPCCLLLSWSVLCVVFLSVDAQDEGEKFVKRCEENVKNVALSASMNDGNCDLLNNCKSECSRVVCSPLNADLQSSLCVRVEVNDICPPTETNQSCNLYMKVNYQRSYVLLAPPASSQQLLPGMTRDICLQRNLDGLFKSISPNTSYTSTFFGSMSGVFRSFPGREEPPDKCITFETRRRPWFKGGISVQKHLKLIVDTGNSMGNAVPPDYPLASGKTFLEVTSKIILKLFKTVSPDDLISVGSFNSSGYYQLGSQVQISNAYDESEESNELAGLENIVKTNLIRSLPGSPSNLTAAILSAVQAFNDTPRDTLKVIIIFTDGQFAALDATIFPSAQLLALRIKIFIFKLPRNSDLDTFLRNTTLPDVLCSVHGTFEVLEPYSTSNPLLAIRSFYTFLATTHLAVAKNQSTWSSIYPSFSQRSNGTTVTYPAFGSDGRLIGVAGIDVFPDQLEGSLRDLVYKALGSRSAKGNLPAPFESVNLVCDYQTAMRSEQQPCNNATSVANGGICQVEDTGTPLKQRVCCSGCGGTTDGVNNGKHWVVVLASVLGVVGAVAIGLALCCCCVSCKTGDEQNTDIPKNPFDQNSSW